MKRKPKKTGDVADLAAGPGRISSLPRYDPKFPELNGWWNLLDSPRFTDLAETMARAVAADLKTPDRNLTPGLRWALRCIALEFGD
jgi:hypothetical protein